jgi:predicted small integral membrane protein
MSVVRCEVVRCGVVWCGVVWCGVVYCVFVVFCTSDVTVQAGMAIAAKAKDATGARKGILDGAAVDKICNGIVGIGFIQQPLIGRVLKDVSTQLALTGERPCHLTSDDCKST